jgi:hypothetical protein
MSEETPETRSREQAESIADDRLVEAMLVSLTPAEKTAQERRIRIALENIEGVAADSSHFREVAEANDDPEPTGRRSARMWRTFGGVGVGLAAMISLAIIMIARPGEAQASASAWFARAEAAASGMTDRVRGYLVEIIPHEISPGRQVMTGRLLIESRGESRPHLRLDIEEPADRRHSIGVDAAGGWHREGDRRMREFPADTVGDRIVIQGVDLLTDPLPGFYARVESDYEIIEFTEVPSPRLVARHRDLPKRTPRSADRIEIVLSPDDWSLQTLVLDWDRSGPGRPPGRPSRADSHRPREHPPAGRGTPPGRGVDRRGGGPRPPMGPPPPARITLDRIHGVVPDSADR